MQDRGYLVTVLFCRQPRANSISAECTYSKINLPSTNCVASVGKRLQRRTVQQMQSIEWPLRCVLTCPPL